MTTYTEAIAAAGEVFARARADQANRTPRQAAELAHVPGGPPVDELEDRIRARRGLPSIDRLTRSHPGGSTCTTSP